MLKMNQLSNTSMNLMYGGRTRRVQWVDMNGDGVKDKIVTIRDKNGNLKREKLVIK